MSELENDQITAWESVPHECPFCRAIDEISWKEFKVYIAYPFYFDAQLKKVVEADGGVPEYRVMCTRCSEDIRREDCKNDEV